MRPIQSIPHLSTIRQFKSDDTQLTELGYYKLEKYARHMNEAFKFKHKPYFFLKSCYSIFFTSLLITGYLINLNVFYFILLTLVAIQMYYFQISKLDVKKANICLKIFKSNNFLGFLILITLFVGKF